MKRSLLSVAALAAAIGAIKLGLEVANAPVLPRADFPALFKFHNDLPDECTSVLVGARALLTAAHCPRSDGTGEIVVAGSTRRWKCKLAPGFSSDHSADWALCQPANTSDPAINVPFERLNDQANALQVSGQLFLTGFGRVNLFTAPDGWLRGGNSTIVSRPSSDNFIRVRDGAELLSGDSGGPAFLLLTGQQNGLRRVAGVNSIGGPAEPGSRLASVTTPTAQSFFSQWASENNIAICGITPGAQGCRQ